MALTESLEGVGIIVSRAWAGNAGLAVFIAEAERCPRHDRSENPSTEHGAGFVQPQRQQSLFGSLCGLPQRESKPIGRKRSASPVGEASQGKLHCLPLALAVNGRYHERPTATRRKGRRQPGFGGGEPRSGGNPKSLGIGEDLTMTATKNVTGLPLEVAPLTPNGRRNLGSSHDLTGKCDGLGYLLHVIRILERARCWVQ